MTDQQRALLEKLKPDWGSTLKGRTDLSRILLVIIEELYRLDCFQINDRTADVVPGEKNDRPLKPAPGMRLGWSTSAESLEFVGLNELFRM